MCIKRFQTIYNIYVVEILFLENRVYFKNIYFNYIEREYMGILRVSFLDITRKGVMDICKFKPSDSIPQNKKGC